MKCYINTIKKFTIMIKRTAVTHINEIFEQKYVYLRDRVRLKRTLRCARYQISRHIS